MWVCYFKNSGENSIVYRYKSDFISPSYINDQKSYNIDSVEFEGNKFTPLKIYQQSENEIICAVGNNFKNDFLTKKFLSPILEITLKFCPDSKEEFDSKYSEEGYPLCDSTYYQSLRDLANSLRKLGLRVVGYKQLQESYVQIKISSDTMQDCLIDSELCRFFSTVVFRNVLGKFVMPRKKLKGSVKVSFEKEKDLEKFINENLVEKINICESRIELVFDKPDLNILKLMPEVLSQEKA